MPAALSLFKGLCMHIYSIYYILRMLAHAARVHFSVYMLLLCLWCRAYNHIFCKCGREACLLVFG